MKVALCTFIILNLYFGYTIVSIEAKYNAIHTEVQESRKANEKVLAMLKEVRNKQEEQNERLEQAMNVTHNKRISNYNVLQLKTNGMNIYTDLGYCSEISVEEMDKIISYYEDARGTAFTGHSEAFIKAAEATGLNPIYLFAHAACESAFGESYIGQVHHNYFGINAVDSNPSAAYVMGDDIDAGIIAGAIWIKTNYYDEGLITLADMHNGGYASDEEWADNIISITNHSISVL